MDIKKNKQITITKMHCNPETGLVRWCYGGAPQEYSERYKIENIIDNDVFLKSESTGKVIKRKKSFFVPFKSRTYYVGDVLTTVKTYINY